MSSKTKIVVLRMKEIIYTAIFIGLGLLLIALLLIMFRPGRKTQSASAPAAAGIHYLPGMYSSTLTLGSQAVNVEVTVDSTQITSVTCRPLSDSIETMYPLLSPSASHLSEQIVSTQSLENLSFESGSQYTSQALLNLIHTALAKAIL